MVTKRQGRHPEGLEKERKKEEAGMLSYAHTLHPEREVPERGKFVENLNAPVKQVHTLSLLPPFLLLSLEALVYT